MAFNSIEEIIEDYRLGKMVLLVDDEDRENEGDLLLAADCCTPEAISFMHIDLNNAAGELAALEVLFDRLVPGGIVVMDDYEWAGIYRAQKKAEDPWFQARGYRLFPLPTGQGMLIKR